MTLAAAITNFAQNALSSTGKDTLNSGSMIFSVATFRSNMT
jgi:hypothetical protein